LRTQPILIVFLLFISIATTVSASETNPRLGLKGLIKIALERNPALGAYYNNYEAAREIYNVSGLQPNPQLVIAGTNGAAPEDSNILSQTFEVFGKTTGRRKKAFSVLRREEARYQIETRNLIADISRTYIEVLNARYFLEVEEENLKLAEIFVNMAQKRYDTGDIPYIQVLDSTIEHSRAKSDLEAALLQEKNAFVELFRLTCYEKMGSTGSLYSLEDLALPPAGALPSSETLRALALENRGELMEAFWVVEESAADKYLARSESNPAIIMAAYRARLLGESSEGVRLSLAVPLFDWGTIGGQVKAAARKEAAAKKQLEDIKNRVLAETDEAYNEAINQGKRLDIINSSIIKKQERMVEMLNRGYMVGLNSYLEVLEGRRRLRTVKKEYYELMALYLKALVKLERATGVEIISKEGSPNVEK